MSIIHINGPVIHHETPKKEGVSGVFANEGRPLSELPDDEYRRLMQALGNPPVKIADVSGRTAEVDPFTAPYIF